VEVIVPMPLVTNIRTAYHPTTTAPYSAATQLLATAAVVAIVVADPTTPVVIAPTVHKVLFIEICS
jgi:hypothetical protein